MASIHDVAKEAGVSVTTVSRVLNNRGYISKEMREKVNAAMERLHYRPNEVARSLFRKTSDVIGLIVPDVSFSFFAELTRAVEEAAYANGCKVMICNAMDNGQKEKEYIRMLRSSMVQGIILGSHTLDIRDFEQLDLPLVTIDRTVPGVPCVTSDNYNGGVLATNALIDRGSQHLLHVRGSSELETPANRRSDAFLDVVLERNCKHTIIETGYNDFDFHEYVTLLERILHEDPSIDGIFASNDILGMAAIRVARLLGRAVPSDLQIIGFDGVQIAELSSPQLSTIKQDIHGMAKEAVRLLQAQMNEKKTIDEKPHVLPVQLVPGETIRN